MNLELLPRYLYFVKQIFIIRKQRFLLVWISLYLCHIDVLVLFSQFSYSISDRRHLDYRPWFYPFFALCICAISFTASLLISNFSNVIIWYGFTGSKTATIVPLREMKFFLFHDVCDSSLLVNAINN